MPSYFSDCADAIKILVSGLTTAGANILKLAKTRKRKVKESTTYHSCSFDTHALESMGVQLPVMGSGISRNGNYYVGIGTTATIRFTETEIQGTPGIRTIGITGARGITGIGGGITGILGPVVEPAVVRGYSSGTMAVGIGRYSSGTWYNSYQGITGPAGIRDDEYGWSTPNMIKRNWTYDPATGNVIRDAVPGETPDKPEETPDTPKSSRYNFLN